MRRIVAIVVVSALAGGCCWFFGLGIVAAAVVALVVGAGGALWRVLPTTGQSGDWPPAPMLAADGSRRETSQLSWSLHTGGRPVGDRVVARVRTIAANRLALRQLDLGNPAHRNAIERLVGTEVYEVVRDESDRVVRLPAVIRILDVLNSLDPKE